MLPETVILSLAAMSGVVSSQQPATSGTSAPAVVGSGSFSPIVANLQKTLTFYALLTKATQAGVQVVTPGGKAVAIVGRIRAVLLEDPDGRPVELRQVDPLPETTAPATSNILGARLSMTVADTHRTMQLYRDRFGFTFDGNPEFVSDPDLQTLTGLKSAQVRRSLMVAPGGRMTFELLEFQRACGHAVAQSNSGSGLGANPVEGPTYRRRGRHGDRHGISRDYDQRQPVPVPPNFLGVIVPDSDNLYLTLIEPCEGCAPRGETVEYTASGKEIWYGTWQLNPSKSRYVNGFQGAKSDLRRRQDSSRTPDGGGSLDPPCLAAGRARRPGKEGLKTLLDRRRIHRRDQPIRSPSAR